MRWVHSTELADPTPWLRGGELLLTTGMQLDGPEDPARADRPARRPRDRRARLRHGLHAQAAAGGAGDRGAQALVSRCSRFPTSCRSSRSPSGRSRSCVERALRNAAAQHGRRRARRGAHRAPLPGGPAGAAAPVRDRRAGGGAGLRARRTRARRRRCWNGSSSASGCAASWRSARGCCARWSTPTAASTPIELARKIRARAGARASARCAAAASRAAPTHSLRLSFHEARCALEAVRLHERRRARGRLLRGPRRLPAAALAAGRRRADLLLPRRARPGRAGGGRLRRGAVALAGRVHRAQRPLGEGGERAVLPPPHAALPHPPRRAADRARLLQRPRPHRVLAGPARQGARRR